MGKQQGITAALYSEIQGKSKGSKNNKDEIRPLVSSLTATAKPTTPGKT